MQGQVPPHESRCQRWRCERVHAIIPAVLVLVLFLLPAPCSPYPTGRRITSSDVADAVDFLTKYGYLPQSDLATGNLRSEDQLKEAIKRMQRFGNIPETGVIDQATLQLMRRKRCGIPDLVGTSERVKRYALQGQKWPKTDLTWSIKDWAPNIDPNMVREQLTKAFRVWSEVSKLTFQEIRSHDADIIVSFLRGPHGDGYPFDGNGTVLAHAFFPGEGIGGDAHFDAEEHWLPGLPDPSSNGVSLFAVAAHEFGHSLGLSHSSVPGSLMFPFYQGLKENFQLPYDDTVGIQQLYGPKNNKPWAPMPTVSIPPRYPPPTKKPTKTKPPTRKPSLTPTPPPPSDVPNTCNSTFDAISVIRREVFVFKDKYFWRINDNGLLRGYPVAIDRFWFNLPQDLERIDAVYERPVDTKIVFFSGKKYWLFNANQPESGYPKPLTDLGLPATLEKVDAALVWGHNGKTYFFSGRQYWRYDEFERRVEPDYPRDMQIWRGIPYNIDAAFQWTDGHTYFFKGDHFWKFNDQKMKVYPDYPKPVAHFWFGCPISTKKRPSDTPMTEQFSDTKEEPEVLADEPSRGHHTSSLPSSMIVTSLVAMLVSIFPI